jgi:hypothetical protein
MRSYLPVTADEIQAFLKTGEMECGPLYAPTIKFLVAHSDMDEEEGEFLLSMLAADEALEMRSDLNKPGLILSLEIEDSEISEHGENFILLKGLANWETVQCAFEVSLEEELTWFATQEIAPALDRWL